MKTSETAQRRTRLILLILTPVLAFVALFSWGLSSSVGSSPDDDFHLASIWCGHGDATGCQSAASDDEREVFSDLVIDSVCYAFNSEASALCQGEDFGQNPEDVSVTPRGNFSGLYPPVFYWTMSWFATPDIETSVLTMRAVNSAIFVALVSVLFWLLPANRRQTLVWGFAVSLVPLGMFLIPSTNPSSWAVISAGVLWISLLGFLESSGRRRVGLGIIAAIAVVMGAGARADAALYSGLAVLLVVLLTFRKNKKYLITALFALALAIAAGLFFLSARQGAAATEGLAGSDAPPVDPLVLAIANIVHVPALWAGALGSWNLGWLDTALPPSVWVATLGGFFAAVFLGLTNRIPRKGLIVSILLAALWIVPTVLLVQSQSMVGANVQPRYILPLMIILAGFLLLQTTDKLIVVNKVQIGLVAAALSLANAVALHTNIRRYVTGSDVGSVNLNSNVEWWWNLAFSPMVVWLIGSLAFAAVMVAISLPILMKEAPVIVAPERAIR